MNNLIGEQTASFEEIANLQAQIDDISTSGMNVTSANIVDGTIQSVDIANFTIGLNKIQKQGITEINKIVVTNPVDGEITKSKLQNTHITDNSISGSKLQSATVPLAKISTNVGQANTILARDVSGFVTEKKLDNDLIADNTISGEKLANNSFSISKIITDPLNANNLIMYNGAGIVINSKIIDFNFDLNTINADKLLNSSITEAQMGNDSVGLDQFIVPQGGITDIGLLLQVGFNGLENFPIWNTITDLSFLNNSISGARLLNNSVTSAQLANNAVETSNIQNNAVTLAKIEHQANGGLFTWRKNNAGAPRVEEFLTNEFVEDGTIDAVKLTGYPNNTTTFLRGDGQWVASGGSVFNPTSAAHNVAQYDASGNPEHGKITDDNIQDATITDSKLAFNLDINNHLTAGTIAASKLQNFPSNSSVFLNGSGQWTAAQGAFANTGGADAVALYNASGQPQSFTKLHPKNMQMWQWTNAYSDIFADLAIHPKKIQGYPYNPGTYLGGDGNWTVPSGISINPGGTAIDYYPVMTPRASPGTSYQYPVENNIFFRHATNVFHSDGSNSKVKFDASLQFVINQIVMRPYSSADSSTIASINGDTIAMFSAGDVIQGYGALMFLFLGDEDDPASSVPGGTGINGNAGIFTVSSRHRKRNIRHKCCKRKDYFDKLMEVKVSTYAMNALDEYTEEQLQNMSEKKRNRIQRKKNQYNMGIVWEELDELNCFRNLIMGDRQMGGPDRDYSNPQSRFVNHTNWHYYLILSLQNMNETKLKPMQQDQEIDRERVKKLEQLLQDTRDTAERQKELHQEQMDTLAEEVSSIQIEMQQISVENQYLRSNLELYQKKEKNLNTTIENIVNSVLLQQGRIPLSSIRGGLEDGYLHTDQQQVMIDGELKDDMIWNKRQNEQSSQQIQDMNKQIIKLQAQVDQLISDKRSSTAQRKK